MKLTVLLLSAAFALMQETTARAPYQYQMERNNWQRKPYRMDARTWESEPPIERDEPAPPCEHHRGVQIIIKTDRFAQIQTEPLERPCRMKPPVPRNPYAQPPNWSGPWSRSKEYYPEGQQYDENDYQKHDYRKEPEKIMFTTPTADQNKRGRNRRTYDNIKRKPVPFENCQVKTH